APADRQGTPQERHAGNRPHTDFDPAHCTGGHCDRRVTYLSVVAQMLVDDLQEMADKWKEGGEARAEVQTDPQQGLVNMLTGLGSLSYGELAGERMKLGLMLHDPEEEHDCFSDNTHNSHYYNQVGMMNVYQGRYERKGGKTVEGTSLSQLVAEKHPALDKEVRARMQDTYNAMLAMKQRSETVETYGQMIAQGKAEDTAVVEAAIDALVAQARSFEGGMAALELGGVNIEGSESLDSPNAVFQ